MSFVKVAANSRKIAEFGIAKKLGIVVFVGISTPLSNLFGNNNDFDFVITIIISYKIKTSGSTEFEDRMGLVLSFDGMVEKTTSKLQISAKTLVIRIGGLIGIGKNLLWLIIFLLSSFGSFKLFFKKLFNS